MPTNDGPRGPISTQALVAEGFAWWELTPEESLAAQVATEERCGIYVLAFSDSQWYVGQSVDLVRRLGEHRKAHGDVVRIYFKSLERSDLDREEARLVAALEDSWGWPIRNIRLSSLPKGELELLDLVPRSTLDNWIKDPDLYLGAGHPREDPDQVRKLADRQSRLENHPLADALKSLTALYLKAAIPLPLTTEREYWSITCVPQGRNPVLLRVNLQWQEVFALVDESDGLRASFYVSRSALPAGTVRRLIFHLKHWGIRRSDYRYEPGGSDQLEVMLRGPNKIDKLLRDPDFIRAVRLFNSRLMLKGRVNPSNAASHCAGWVSGLGLG